MRTEKEIGEAMKTIEDVFRPVAPRYRPEELMRMYDVLSWVLGNTTSFSSCLEDLRYQWDKRRLLPDITVTADPPAAVGG